MSDTKRLPEPEAVARAQSLAEQVLSVWLVDRNEVAATFLPNLHSEDLGNWGRLLADVARFIAHAHADKHNVPQDWAMEKLRIEFNDQVQNAPRDIKLKRDVPRGGQ